MKIHELNQGVTSFRPRATLRAVLCGVVGVAVAGAASAATPEDVPSAVVHYDASTLTTDAGVHALYRRLVRAADKVCPDEFTGSRIPSDAARDCRKESVARAVRQIGNSQLVAVFASSTKRG